MTISNLFLLFPFFISIMPSAHCTIAPKQPNQFLKVNLAQIDSRTESQTNFIGASPRLVDFSTPYTGVAVDLVRYYLTIDIPKEISPGVKKISMGQLPNMETVEFDLSKTVAFLGDRTKRGDNLDITVNQIDDTILVEFQEAIEGGNRVTIGFLARQNPQYAGVYLFRFQVFPVGNNPVGMNLSVGRLHFYERIY